MGGGGEGGGEGGESYCHVVITPQSLDWQCAFKFLSPYDGFHGKYDPNKPCNVQSVEVFLPAVVKKFLGHVFSCSLCQLCHLYKPG